MFCKTVHVHSLYCDYKKNSNRVRTVEKRGKLQSVLGRWFRQLKNHVVRNKTKDRDPEIMNRDRDRSLFLLDPLCPGAVLYVTAFKVFLQFECE